MVVCLISCTFGVDFRSFGFLCSTISQWFHQECRVMLLLKILHVQRISICKRNILLFHHPDFFGITCTYIQAYFIFDSLDGGVLERETGKIIGNITEKPLNINYEIERNISRKDYIENVCSMNTQFQEAKKLRSVFVSKMNECQRINVKPTEIEGTEAGKSQHKIYPNQLSTKIEYCL